jgi:hypothetical protein
MRRNPYRAMFNAQRNSKNKKEQITFVIEKFMFLTIGKKRSERTQPDLQRLFLYKQIYPELGPMTSHK